MYSYNGWGLGFIELCRAFAALFSANAGIDLATFAHEERIFGRPGENLHLLPIRFVLVPIERGAEHLACSALVAQAADAAVLGLGLQLLARDPRVGTRFVGRLRIADKHYRRPDGEVTGLGRVVVDERNRRAKPSHDTDVASARLFPDFTLQGVFQRLEHADSASRAVDDLNSGDGVELCGLPLPLLVGADVDLDAHYAADDFGGQAKNSNGEARQTSKAEIE